MALPWVDMILRLLTPGPHWAWGLTGGYVYALSVQLSREKHEGQRTVNSVVA